MSTDTNGFASISYTPSSTGDYTVRALKGGTVVERTTVTVADRLAKSDYRLSRAIKGAINTYGAYVETTSGVLANTDVVVRFYKDFGKTNLLTKKTVTTDDSGFLTVDYDVPSDYSDNTLYLSAETGTGDPIGVPDDTVRVSESSSDTGSIISLSAEFGSFRYAPGDSVTINVEATDGGNPITNQDVDVFLRYGFDGPPEYSTTVTTDSNGTASASTTLPSDAPDGESLSGTVGMQYGGNTYQEGLYAQVQELNYNFSVPKLTPGASETFSIDVTDDSGNAVSGVPFLFDARYGNGQTGSFGTVGLESTSDGTDSGSVTVPSDIGFEGVINWIYRYQGTRSALLAEPDLQGTLSTGDTTLSAGETTSFDFSVSDSVTLYGFAFGSTPAGRTFATQFQGPGSFSLTIPEEFESGDSMELTVWTIDGNGDRYYDETDFKIDESSFLDERWRTDVGARAQYAQLATDGTNVFAGNLGSEVRALAPADGGFAWSTSRAGALSDSSPAVASGVAYVGSGGGTLYALDAGTGAVNWSLTTSSAIVSSPTVNSSVVYVGANDGTVRAVDTSGTQQWATTLNAPVYSRPAVANGRVHVTTADGELVTLDTSDGSELWRLSTGAPLGHTGVIEDGGSVYLPADKLYALDASDGSQQWSATFGGPSGSTPALASSTLYVGSSDGSVYAVNTDGTSAWSTSTGGAVASDPAVVSGRVIVGSADGSLYVLDASDGSSFGSASLGAPTRSSPVVLNDNVYIGTRGGVVISLANVTG